MHEIKKHKACPPAGEYTVRLVRNADGVMLRQITVACPNCQALHSLDAHGIGFDGTVSPSIICTRKGCGFHDHIRLLDWEADGEDEEGVI